MNNVYFACTQCYVYIDAGYRWAMTSLFPDKWNSFPIPVSVDEILSCNDYWSGKSHNKFLEEQLSRVHEFLLTHRAHRLLFGDADSFLDFDNTSCPYLRWLDLDSIRDNKAPSVIMEPRFLIEHPAFLYTSWQQVEEYCNEDNCHWMRDPDAKLLAKGIFESIVSSRSK